MTSEELVEIVDIVMFTDPKKSAMFTEDELDKMLLDFCINCPDPVSAMRFFVRSADLNAEAIVAKALACVRRDPNDLPDSELAISHPLRYMKLED